MNANVI